MKKLLICRHHDRHLIPPSWPIHHKLSFLSMENGGPRLYSFNSLGPSDAICISNLTTIGSVNGSTPSRRQAITRTNAGILLIGPLWTNFSEILIEIPTFSFKKMHSKVSSAKWRQFCLGPNVLIHSQISGLDSWYWSGQSVVSQGHLCDDSNDWAGIMIPEMTPDKIQWHTNIIYWRIICIWTFNTDYFNMILAQINSKFIFTFDLLWSIYNREPL